MINFGLENILYQGGDRFTTSLVEACDDIVRKVQSGAIRKTTDRDNIEAFANISKLVKDRMGLNIKYEAELSPFFVAAVIAFAGDSISLGDSMGGATDKAFLNNLTGAGMSFTKLLKRINKIQDESYAAGEKVRDMKGTVNFERAVVTGYFTKVPHFLMIDPVLLVQSYNITGDELAAIIDHEIGHAFTGLMHHYRLITTNTAIQHALNAANNNNTREAVYQFKSVFTKEEFMEAQLNDDSTNADFYAAAGQYFVNELVRSQYQDDTYDKTSWEYSADSFAVRFGLGASLATGLRKLETHPHSGIAKRPILNLYNFWVILTILCSFGSAFFGMVLMLFLAVLSVFRAKMVSTYDGTKERYHRMMREINDILKNRDLPIAYKRSLTQQWEVIRDVFEDTSDQFRIDIEFWKFILPSLRKRKYYFQKQNEIEQLLNNELFTQTARLEILGA